MASESSLAQDSKDPVISEATWHTRLNLFSSLSYQGEKKGQKDINMGHLRTVCQTRVPEDSSQLA